jgi:hypothetical protein
MTKVMGQVHSVQTFDQQLYAIAKQVEWAIPETFRNYTVRLGGFAVKDDALLLICTDLSCDLFFFDWLILGSTA